jgi:hypothetical protein
MTKETIKKETTEIIKRIEALESIPASVHDFSRNVIIGTMLKEYKDRYEYLTSSKEFMVHFEGGGWNTCYGVNKEEAFDNAVKDFCNGDNSKYSPLVVKSVSLATEEGIASAMRLFY